jgi:hypothetical protein
MPRIGSLTFKFVKGIAQLPSNQVLPLEQMQGIDGDRYRLAGKRGRPSEYVSIFDSADATKTLAQIKAEQLALKGTVVTVVNDFGESYANTMVLDVEFLSADQSPLIIGGITASSDRVVISRWTVLHQQEAT